MTTAYPLKWPEGWPRTPVNSRASGSQFVVRGYAAGQTYKSSRPISFDKARRTLFEELERLGANRVTMSTDLPIRADGTPRIDRLRSDTDPGVAIYFMLKNRPMVMAQDRFDNMPSNIRSLALAIDAMRSLERHGGGTMMERAFDGFSALPPPAGSKPVRPWWDVMRFSKDPEDWEIISTDEIEARFRTLAKQRHPDAGGNAADMAELNAARIDALKAVQGP